MTQDKSFLRRVARDSAIYGLATLVARGVNVLLIPLYTRVLSPADFGVSDVLLTLLTLVGIVSSLEVSQALMRFYAEARTEAHQQAIVSSSFWFVAVGHLLLIAALMPFSTSLSRLMFGSADYSMPVVIMLVTLFFYGLFNLTSIALRVRLQSLEFSLTSFVLAAVSGLTTILFVLVFDLGLMGILLGNLSGYVAATGLCIFLARGDYKLIVDWGSLGNLLRFSAPLVPSSLGYFLTFYINRLALNFLLTLDDVGIYSIAYRLASPVNMIMNSLSSSLTPLIYNTYRQDQTPFELARIFRLLTAATFLLLLALSIFAVEILHLMTTPNYYSAAVIIPFLALSAALSGFYIFTPGLFIANDTWLISAINVASGLLNVGLNYVLIPALGLTGAALATCLALLVNLAVSMFFSQKRYHIPIQWDRIGWGGLISIVIVSVGMSFHVVELRVIVIKSLLLLVAAALFVAVRLVEWYEVTGFWKLVNSRVRARRAGSK